MHIISPEKPAKAASRPIETLTDLFLPAPFERSTVMRN
jgi:hypothetical protein